MIIMKMSGIVVSLGSPGLSLQSIVHPTKGLTFHVYEVAVYDS